MPSVLGNTPLDANVMLAPPYDSEVEYLESTGTQYIDTGISMASNSAVPMKVSVDSYGIVNHGIIHNNVAGGTWLGVARPIDLADFRIYKDNYNTKVARAYSDARHIHVWDGASGFYEDGILIESFTAGVGTDDITGIPWYLGRMYDFYTSSPQTSNTKAYRIYSAQMRVNGVLVRDFIPVRKNGVGYLYDKVSGQLFGNAGTGDPFILGPDVDVHNALVRADANFTNLKYWLTDSTFTFKPTITFNSGWSAATDIQIRLINGRIGAITGDIKCTSALTAGTAYSPFSAVSYPPGISLYQGCSINANQRLFTYYNNASTRMILEDGIAANTTIYLRGLIPMTVNPDTAPSYVKYIAPLF